MRSFWICIVLAALPLCPAEAGEAKKKQGRSSPEAAKAYREAAQLVGAKDPSNGIVKLQAFLEKFPNDPLADKAKIILLENGVGTEVRVLLETREVFREKLKIPEKSVLEQGEKTLKQLREWYKGFKKPYFKKSKLVLHFYDNQARFREKGGQVTAAGHFTAEQYDPKLRPIDGKIEWYFPREAGSATDRQTFMAGLLFHEMTHYLNAIQYGFALPGVLDEGIATWFTSRLNTEFYQTFRTTDRQRLESNARNGLNAIAKFEDFARMLEASRGFGQGDVMLDRWYGLCYAMVDFIIENGIGGKKTAPEKLLEILDKLISEELAKASGQEKASPPNLRAILETLIRDLYGEKLEAFHRELLKYIMARYKQN